MRSGGVALSGFISGPPTFEFRPESAAVYLYVSRQRRTTVVKVSIQEVRTAVMAAPLIDLD